jgi:hypothetical protein
MWNRALLKKDIAEDTRIIRQLKAHRKEMGSSWGTYDYLALRNAKGQATVHHSIAAHLNHKLHLHQVWDKKAKAWKQQTPEDQMKLIEKALTKYKLEDPSEKFQRAMESMDLAGELSPTP